LFDVYYFIFLLLFYLFIHEFDKINHCLMYVIILLTYLYIIYTPGRASQVRQVEG